MGRIRFIFKNLGRKKVRTFLTGGAIFIAFTLFGLLASLNHAFNFGVDIAGANRLITTHKVSLLQLMPISYHSRIAMLDGVEHVSHFTWFGGYYQDPENQFPMFPTDAENMLDVYTEYNIPEQQRSRWLRNRTGLLVGRTMADSFGWDVGDTVPLRSIIFENRNGGNTWEFVIDAIYTGNGTRTDEFQAYMHYDYFNETRTFTRDEVGWFVIQVSNPDNASVIADQIDGMFANSANETKTSTEKGFVQAFADQIGNIGAIVIFVLAVVLFSIFLICSNAIAQSVTERTAEFGVMKTLGFTDARILKMVLGESMILTFISGILGVLFSTLLIGALRYMVAEYLPGLVVTVEHLLLALLVMLILSVVAGLIPSLQAMRLNVSTALSRR